MFKLFYLLTLFFDIFNLKQQDIVIDNQEEYYLLTLEEENSEIVDKIGNYYLMKGDYYYLICGEKRINLGILDDALIFVYHDKLYLIYLINGALSINYYYSDLRLIKEIEIARSGIVSINLNIVNNYLIITGGANEDSEVVDFKLGGIDSFLCEFDLDNDKSNINYYGGKTNEYFDYSLIIDNNFYICGHKDSYGEGDFGNGGGKESIFITCLDEKRDIKKYIILDDNTKILTFFYYHNKLYLASESGYYIFDNDLNIIKKVIIDEEVIQAIFNNRGLFCLFSPTNSYVIDLNKGINKIIKHNLNLEYLKKQSEYLLGKFNDKLYRIDLISLSNKKIYHKYNEDKSIDTLFSLINPNSEVISPYLDYQVYGDYKVSLNYSTLGGINFIYNTTLNIPFECNITNGGIYPYGYHLLFTGKAYLNGNLIINNYQLVNIGKHHLLLKGINGEEKEFDFTVSSNQINFIEEVNKDYDILAELGDQISIKMKFDLPSNFTVLGAIIDEEFYECDFNNELNILYIPYKKASEVGLEKINLDRIIYKDEINEYYSLVDQEYLICVKKPKLDIKLSSITDEMKISIDCIDINNVTRYFEIVKKSEATGDEESFKYPIATSEVILDNFDNDNYIIMIYLASDYGEDKLDRVLLTSMNVNGSGQLYLGKIEILSYEGTLNRFSIDIDKKAMEDEIKLITINDQILYINERGSYLKYVLLFVLVFILGIMIPIIVKGIINFNKKDELMEDD